VCILKIFVFTYNKSAYKMFITDFCVLLLSK
jgi:hypothetical protein